MRQKKKRKSIKQNKWLQRFYHQLAGGHSGVNHFQAPAQTGIDQKIGQRLVQRKAADGGLGEEGYHKNTSGQFCFATILYSSPGSKKGQAAVRQER